ncbi:MAG: chemotaxis protein CheW [Anaerolineaceae bacterium]|nr:chemotaxis protein CheW [Anaerolineaceae bacterium]
MVIGLSSNSDQLENFVIFRQDNKTFAFKLVEVREIIRMVNVTEVPETPAWFAGVINLAGTVVPIMNMNDRLGYHEKTLSIMDRIIIIQSGQSLGGIIIEKLVGVQEFPVDKLSPINDPRVKNLPIKGILQQQEELAILWDSEKMIDSLYELKENWKKLTPLLDEIINDKKSPIPKTLELTQIDGIGEKTAAKLDALGIINLEKLAAARPSEILEILGFSDNQMLKVRKWIAQAGVLAENNS